MKNSTGSGKIKVIPWAEALELCQQSCFQGKKNATTRNSKKTSGCKRSAASKGKRPKTQPSTTTELCSSKEEKEKVERLQCEKPQNIVVAEAPKKMMADLLVELNNKRRQREREAARMALEKMENTAGLELNSDVFKELWILSEGSLSSGKPLNQLGLFIKKEYLDDEDEDDAFLYDDDQEKAAKIRAAEALELQKQRESERQAARIALEKMENTASLELNSDIFKELWILSGGSLSPGKPLNQLGLFIKHEYMVGEDDYEAFLYEDIEEGEIV